MTANNYGIRTERQLQEIEAALDRELIAGGIACALLIDAAGNTIAVRTAPDTSYDTYAFAALAAGNYATVDSLAKLVGEEAFDQLYHRGERTCIHFGRISDELLLVTVFDRDVPLGFVRLRVAELRKSINEICSGKGAGGSSSSGGAA